jgi:putative membrane protein
VPEHPTGPTDIYQPVVAGLLLLAALAGYLACAVAVRRHGRWPVHRDVLWCAGLGAVAAALIGPLAEVAHRDFVAHMVGHLLLGMLAPLLLVLAAPVTLALRVLPVARGRRLARLLASKPLQVLTHPVPAAALNLAGLWLLYTTDLYQAMSHQAGLHAAAHFHMLAAGYLFTFAMVGIDPSPHRPGHPTRTVVLVLYLAAHAVLAKHLYGYPAAGVTGQQAASGAMLMYYGGDAIDLAVIIVFCRQWFISSRPRHARRIDLADADAAPG